MHVLPTRPLSGKVTKDERAERNRRDKETLVRQGQSHALIVYKDHNPVGWCQYGAKEELPRIELARATEGTLPLPARRKAMADNLFLR